MGLPNYRFAISLVFALLVCPGHTITVGSRSFESHPSVDPRLEQDLLESRSVNSLLQCAGFCVQKECSSFVYRDRTCDVFSKFRSGSDPATAGVNVFALTTAIDNSKDFIQSEIDHGYTVAGDSSMTCTVESGWGQPPVCIPHDCGPPPTLLYGVVKIPTGTTLDQTVHYRCDNGFAFDNGSSEFYSTCSTSGWTMEPPSSAGVR